jgi:hypothetical protein
MYALFFETEGDLTNADVVEFNDTRDRFLAQFGSFIARNLCAFVLYTDKVDWKEGVTEPELGKVMQEFFVLMIFLLSHEDVCNGPTRLCVSFDGNDFRAWKRKPDSEPHRS